MPSVKTVDANPTCGTVKSSATRTSDASTENNCRSIALMTYENSRTMNIHGAVLFFSTSIPSLDFCSIFYGRCLLAREAASLGNAPVLNMRGTTAIAAFRIRDA